MKHTILLAVLGVTLAVGLTGGAQAESGVLSLERLRACLLLELADKHACASYDASLVQGYVDAGSSTNPDHVLRGETSPVAQSVTR